MAGMIVAAEGSELLVITQNDHAHLAAEILSLWRSDGLPDHPRRADLLFAVREHDNGWRETDSAPRANPETGRPHDFLSLPREDRIELWERGTARFAGERPYPALLIARHAYQLHRGRDREKWGEFLEFLEELQRGLLEAAGVPEEVVAEDYRWLDLADLLSLAICNRREDPFERYGTRGRFGGHPDAETLLLDPFPLAGTTIFKVPCRRIPHRAYAGDADLGGELAAARWRELRVRVAPPPQAISSGT